VVHTWGYLVINLLSRIIMDNRFLALVLLFVVLPLYSLAGEVYRMVDADGNVTYTDAPPAADAAVEKIDIQPGPSEESRRDTEQRNAAIRRAMEEARNERLKKESSHKEQLGQARKALEEAEDALERTKALGEGDRQYLSGGRSRIRPEYFERLKAAEEAVEEARKKYKGARGY
jgi:hypothetical protein